MENKIKNICISILCICLSIFIITISIISFKAIETVKEQLVSESVFREKQLKKMSDIADISSKFAAGLVLKNARYDDRANKKSYIYMEEAIQEASDKGFKPLAEILSILSDAYF